MLNFAEDIQNTEEDCTLGSLGTFNPQVSAQPHNNPSANQLPTETKTPWLRKPDVCFEQTQNSIVKKKFKQNSTSVV